MLQFVHTELAAWGSGGGLTLTLLVETADWPPQSIHHPPFPLQQSCSWACSYSGENWTGDKGSPPGPRGQSGQVLARGMWVVQLWPDVGAGLEASPLPLSLPQLQPNWWAQGWQRALGKDQGVRTTREAAAHSFPKATTQEKSHLHYLICCFVRLLPSPFLSLSIFLPPSMIFFLLFTST